MESLDKNSVSHDASDITPEYRLTWIFEYHITPQKLEDIVPPYPPREMCLWNKTQIHAVVKEMSKKIRMNSTQNKAHSWGNANEES